MGKRRRNRRSSNLPGAAGVLFAVFLALVGLSGCLQFHRTPEEAAAFFADSSRQPEHRPVEADGGSVHFVQTGSPGSPMVLFIHGSPSAWDVFAPYLAMEDLADRAHLVAVDRLGYGDSQPGTVEPSVERQAAAIRPVLDLNESGLPAILVGHSYGGAVAARLAMDDSDQVGGLVLVSAALDPELVGTSWTQHVISQPLIRLFVPPEWSVSTRELLSLEPELEDMLPRWQNISVPVSIIHGEVDTITPIGHAEFALRRLVQADVDVARVEDLDHFVPWRREDLIHDAIARQLDRLNAKGPATQSP